VATGGNLLRQERNSLLQVTDAEILLSLNAKRNIPLSRRDILSLCLLGIFLLGAGIYLLIPHRGLAPTPGEVLFPILLSGFAIMILLPSITLLVMSLRSESLRTPRFVRIDREGVFFSPLLSTVVTWSEISTLTPYTLQYLGLRIPALGIILRDSEAITARIIADHSGNVFSHAVSTLNIWFYRRSKALTPLNILQPTLSISIDELITVIRERFGNELNEHHVAISGWESVGG
jgi:hypothetical protein